VLPAAATINSTAIDATTTLRRLPPHTRPPISRTMRTSLIV
jgi:hypothetical protein